VPPQAVTPPDETLARQAVAGEMTAFEELVRRHEGRVYGFLARCTGCEADARDITQETFVAAYRKLGQFAPRQRFASWLFGIARRKLVDHLRARRPATQWEDVELLDPSDPAEHMASQEAETDLWARARRRLPDLQFQALWLRYAEDMSVREIATVLRRTPTHVKVLLFRARTTLAAALVDAAPGRGATAPTAGAEPPVASVRPLPTSVRPAFGSLQPPCRP